jgi:lipoate-protein ligase A
MHFLDTAYTTPAEQLACDDVLLDLCEEGKGDEVLRIWIPEELFVVVGYTNEAEREVDLAACAEAGIPLFRRTTGGGTVVQGPGCFNYALIMRQGMDPALATITGTNRFVLGRLAATLTSLLGREVAMRGHTDLALGEKKFAGNAQRRRGHSILFHGTLLLDFDIRIIERLLSLPSTQPGYRHGRSHADFLTNLHAAAADVSGALRRCWNATAAGAAPPLDRIRRLARERYQDPAWIYRR